MEQSKSPLVRRVFVDSGPAGTTDDGDRVMVFRPDGVALSLSARTVVANTTTAMTDVVGLDLRTSALPVPGRRRYMPGFEGSDLVATYYALDQLGRFDSIAEVEVVGDGQAIAMLEGKGKVSAKWGGKNWVPALEAKIREAEASFSAVRYRVIPSRLNPAGSDAKVVRFENLRRRSGKGFR